MAKHSEIPSSSNRSFDFEEYEKSLNEIVLPSAPDLGDIEELGYHSIIEYIEAELKDTIQESDSELDLVIPGVKFEEIIRL